MMTELDQTSAPPSASPGGAAATADATTEVLGVPCYHIAHYDRLDPFFMTLVSPGDHWLFLSSTGGLSAGRVDAENALFPYYTDDKLAENSENTGPKAVLRVGTATGVRRWEPFSALGEPGRTERHLYKSVLGHVVVFEERHLELGLRYRAAWRTGERFGLVHSAWLINDGAEAREVEILGGLQNLLPAGATTQLTRELSNLLDAYKRSELDAATGLGVYTLNATLTDRAEPSESLRATTVWSTGLEGGGHLLSSGQLRGFRERRAPVPEHEVRGRRGAYFVHARRTLPPGAEVAWHFAAELRQDSAQVIDRRDWLAATPSRGRAEALEADLADSTEALEALLSRVDGLQLTADERASGRHLANTLFNTMRGGLFEGGDWIETADLRAYAAVRQPGTLERHADFWAALPGRLKVDDLRERARASADADLERLCTGYLPLSFSRRHGDPSRPWNRFAIRLRHPDGTRRLDYQGNWRDIFQNWEGLAYSAPAFLPGMISAFLCATTADGYNPYRVTRRGLEWEEPEPENPWANIGYWSDHQIIYLGKLLEAAQALRPGELEDTLDRRVYSHAQVPYRIKPYAEILEDWSDTITYDHALSADIHAREAREGSDARLLRAGGGVLHVSLTEKLLTLLLAKLVNLVPGGGLWMNTQRPEWNDANNALVGKGLSVVTVAYLRRFLGVCRTLLAAAPEQLSVTRELADWLTGVRAVLDEAAGQAATDPAARRAFMDRMGEVGDTFRAALYRDGPAGNFGGTFVTLERGDVLALLDAAGRAVDEILDAGRRGDGLWHAYNVLRLDGPEQEGGAHVGHLPVMLEGQVAALSAGKLSPEEALTLLRALRQSDLYRPDQHSYLLYPDRAVASFFEKNRLDGSALRDLALVPLLDARGDGALLRRDARGDYHFGGDFHNAGDLRRALDELETDPALTAAVQEARAPLLALFEQTFDHASFTGRSATFFAYEGLGSVYWHMVSKLLLAVQEQVFAAREAGASPETLAGLIHAYEDIRAGLSYNRTPEQYGAFPTDPYSHTPASRGAQQPGMTGQVKEELLTRPAELGLRFGDGTLHFDPTLLRGAEALPAPRPLRFLNASGEWQSLEVPAGALALTVCQVPVLVARGDADRLSVTWADGRQEDAASTPGGLSLRPDLAHSLFTREGRVQHLSVTFGSQAR